MATVGSSTGLDVSSIVGQLMTIERRPLATLASKEAAVTARIAALSRVQGAVSGLQAAAATLAKAVTFTGHRAAVAGDGVAAAVTDSAKAVAGSYAIKVTTLAASHALASGQFDAATDVLGNGTLRLQLGAGTPVDIAIGAGSNTLAGVRDAINGAKAGVTASLVTDGGKQRLTLTATATGAASTIKLTVQEDGSTFGDAVNLDETGLSRLAFDGAVALTPPATTAPGRQMLQTRAAADAQFEVNGLALSATSNKVTGVIDGVALDLKLASATAVATLTIERDTAAVRTVLTDFVKTYNDLDKTIRDLTAYDAANRRAAILNGDSSVRSLQGQLRSITRSAMSAAGGDYTTLSQVGLEVGRDGSLSVNAARLDAALADPDKLARLFTTTADDEAARGFGVRLKSFADALVSEDGLLPSRTKGLQAQVEVINKQEERLNLRLTLVEQRLKRQYSALDVALQRMQGTSDSLANALKQLPGAGTSA